MLKLGWSLRDIDETDIESLLPFWFHLVNAGEGETNSPGARASTGRVYCDQVGL